MEVDGNIDVRGFVPPEEPVVLMDYEILENLKSLNTFIANNLRNVSIDSYNKIFEPLTLTSLIESCSGWRSLYDNNGNGYGNEPVTNALMLGILPNLYLKIKERDLYVSYYSLFEEFFNLDYGLKNSSCIYNYRGDIEIDRLIGTYLGMSQFSNDNIEYFKTKGLSINSIEVRVKGYVNNYLKLKRHIDICKKEDAFELQLCSISARSTSPYGKLYTDDIEPRTINEILDSLIFRDKGFYVTDLINDEGVIKFKTTKDDGIILTYTEMKELCKELLENYIEEVTEEIIKLNNLNKDLDIMKINNLDDLITFIRKYEENKNEDTKES